MNLFDELDWRGLVFDATDGAREALDHGPITAYGGFDATAQSLHVGHLLPVLALARLQRAGHRPIALVGGGTGLIGDPSGKSSERILLDVGRVEANAAAVTRQLAGFLDVDSGQNAALVLNNAEWLSTMTAMEFLRDVGKHFSVNAMLSKESVRRRLEGEDGISYTELSYSLLQAHDYVRLHERHGCTLQIGGSDQWGNILAGCDLNRRVSGARVHGLVMPLLTTAAGTKFGKTEAGTVWIDPTLTSPYAFFQFWLNVDDRDVEGHFKRFTFLGVPRIQEIVAASVREPEKRLAQRELARIVTRLVHGDAQLADAESAAEKLFTGDVRGMTEAQLRQVFGHVPSATTSWPSDPWPVSDFLVANGVTASKGEAVRLIRGGGVYVNDRRVSGEKDCIELEDALPGGFFVVRKGKKGNHVIHVKESGSA